MAKPTLSSEVAWRPAKVPSTMNYPALEDGGFGKLPRGCALVLPWPGQWGHVSGIVLILRDIAPHPLSPGCYQSPGIGSRLASSSMHLRADRRNFPLHGMSVPLIPRSRVPVRQDGFKLSPNCQPKSCVSIRKGLDMVFSVPLWLPPEDAQHRLWAGHC